MEDALTLAINALRDIAESKRMPSGLSVVEEIAAVHEDAARKLETWRALLRIAAAMVHPEKKAQ